MESTATPVKAPLTINEFARMGGLKGGKSRSRRKIKSSRQNLAHAREILEAQRNGSKPAAPVTS